MMMTSLDDLGIEERTRMNRDENVETDDGKKRIKKIRTEEIKARAGVANINEKIREARPR